jgi:hypothetical protein
MSSALCDMSMWYANWKCLLHVCEWPPCHNVCWFLLPWTTSRPPMKAIPTTWSIVGECSGTSLPMRPTRKVWTMAKHRPPST